MPNARIIVLEYKLLLSMTDRFTRFMVDVVAAFHQHFCRSGVRKNNIGILSEAKPRVFPTDYLKGRARRDSYSWETRFSEGYNIAMTYRK